MKTFWMLFGLLPFFCSAQNLDWVAFQGDDNRGDQLYESLVTADEDVVFCGTAYYASTGYGGYIINLSNKGVENWRVHDTTVSMFTDILSDADDAVYGITRTNRWRGNRGLLLVIKYDDLGNEDWRHTFPSTVATSAEDSRMSLDYNGDVVVSMPKVNGGVYVYHIDGQNGTLNWVEDLEQIGALYLTRSFAAVSNTDSTLDVLVEVMVPGKTERSMAIWTMSLEKGATLGTTTVLDNVWGLNAKGIAGQFVVFGNPEDTVVVKGTKLSFDDDEGVVIGLSTGAVSPQVYTLKGEDYLFNDVGIDANGQIHTTGKNDEGHAYLTKYTNRLTPAWTVETPCNGLGDRISFFEDGSVLWSGDELNNHNRGDTFYVSSDKSQVALVNQNTDVFVSRISEPNTSVFQNTPTVFANPYPNPVLSTVNLELPESVEHVQLVNVLGETIQVAIEGSNAGQLALDVSNLTPGIYSFLLTTTEQTTLRSGSFIKL